MPDTIKYLVFALAWVGFALLLGKYIRMKRGALKRQVVLGFGVLLFCYFIGLGILFIGILSS
jgi:hypothetical protein